MNAKIVLGIVALAVLAACAPPTQEAGEVREIVMEAKRYEFIPGSAEPIRVKQNDIVRIRATATDVSHGFAINEYGINVGLPVGQEKIIEFVADKPGTFTFYCSVYCGPGHGGHKGTLIVEPR